MSTIINFILSRLSEPSTWQGILMLAGALHFHLTDVQLETVATYLTGICGAIMALKSDPRPVVFKSEA